jgi:CheY-like chemotaxis protein
MLNGIMGFTDLLCLAETDPVRLKYLDGIKRATARSADLTQKLLAFGRRGKNLVEPVNLQQAVEECLGMLKPSMNSNLSVAVDFQGPCWISGDPSQIQQVLVNLCINAMEAMQEGGRLTLTCRPRALGPKEGVGVGVGVGLPEGQYLELKVSDEGTGMPEEVLERIFEPFFTTKNDGRTIGSGLGLSTVYGIVMAHNGDISVESELGRGTRFRLLFPATAVSAMLGPASAPGARSLQSTEPATGKILMVEDESILLELGERALETLGYTPLTARNGLEGVETFRQHHADLRMVLLDLKMPDMGGHEAFINMHLIDPAVPVIICTGYGDNEEVHHLIGLGAKNMLSKPYTIAGLADALTLNARVLATTNRTGGAT